MFKLRKKRVFISYSSTDSKIIDKVKQELEKNSIIVIIDSDFLEAGDDITRIIREKIEKCDVLILALSKESIKSKWVKMEYHFAMDHRKKIIPILLKDAEQKDIPPYLQNTKNVDLSDDMDGGLNELIYIFKPPPFLISLTAMLILFLMLFPFILLLLFILRVL